MIEKYNNCLFSILGDSISTLEGCSEPVDSEFYRDTKRFETNVFHPEDTWWGQVIKSLGAKLLVNNSISGSMVIKHPRCEISSYGCSDDRTSALSRNGKEPDVIMVFLGVNDWGCGVRIARYKETDGCDVSTFADAYEEMLKKLKRNYPLAEIWCFTLPITDWKRCEEFSFPYSYGGRHIDEYCEIIRSVSSNLGCKLIDINRHGVPYSTIDGFHPDKEGMQTLAKSVLSLI